MMIPGENDTLFWSSYAKADRDLCVRHARIGCLLAFIFVPLGSSLEYFIYPDLLWTILVVRLLCALAILPIWFALGHPWGRRHVDVLGSLWPLVPAASMVWMIAISEGWASPYYAGLNLVIAVTGILMPYTRRQAMMICMLVIAGYVVACLWHQRVSGMEANLRDIYGNLFFMVVTSVITVTASHFFHRKRILDFHLRHQLDAKNQQLDVQNRRLADSYEKLSELDRLRTQFFANVSHELRTPLTLIISPVEDLLHSDLRLGDKEAELLGIARQNGLRLLKLINDLLEVARLDAGRMELRRECMDLATFIPGVVESIRYLAEAKDLRLEANGRSDGLVIQADPSRLEKILLNLLTNAIKFTPKGGIIIVEWSRDGTDAVFSVTDTGIGIPADEHKHLFSRFHQVDGSSTRRYQGMGIGLALVKELVEEHGGRITADSNIERGTCMRVRLPIDEATLPAAGVPPAQATGPARESTSASDPADDALSDIYRSAERRGGVQLDDTGLHEPRISGSGARLILVVDDEPDMRRYLVARLVEKYRVVQAVDGLQAVEVALAQRPDLVLLDLMLPGIDGIAVCRRLRTEPSLARTRIILLTARGDEETKITALDAGADDFLTKPFSTIEVRSRIATQLRAAELQRLAEERADELAAALARLREAESMLVQSEKMHALGSLAAGLLHEINNPLNYSQLAVTLAREKVRPGDDSLAEMLKDAHDGMTRIGSVICSLRTFAYPDTIDFSQSFPIVEAIDLALRFTSLQCNQVVVRRRIAPGLSVCGSVNQVSMVLVNLVANASRAIQAVEDGRQGCIAVVAREEGDIVRIEVIDNGVGMDAERTRRAFDPFYTTSAPGKGMGLGLTICHTVVRNHRGRIGIDSRPGTGTTVWIELPTPAALAASEPSHG